MPIIRYVKINSSVNPFVKEDNKYYINRRKVLKKLSENTKQNCIIIEKFTDIDKNLLILWKLNAG